MAPLRPSPLVGEAGRGGLQNGCCRVSPHRSHRQYPHPQPLPTSWRSHARHGRGRGTRQQTAAPRACARRRAGSPGEGRSFPRADRNRRGPCASAFDSPRRDGVKRVAKPRNRPARHALPTDEACCLGLARIAEAARPRARQSEARHSESSPLPAPPGDPHRPATAARRPRLIATASRAPPARPDACIRVGRRSAAATETAPSARRRRPSAPRRGGPRTIPAPPCRESRSGRASGWLSLGPRCPAPRRRRRRCAASARCWR